MDSTERLIFWNKIIRFVDDFRRDPTKEKMQEVDMGHPDANAFFAGVVEKLSQEQSIEPPVWIFKKKYYLQEPFFMGELKGISRILTILETPLAFKTRNIYIGANTFDRC